MGRQRRRGRHPRFWLRRLVALGVLLCLSELLWLRLGVNVLVAIVGVALVYSLARVGARIRSRSTERGGRSKRSTDRERTSPSATRNAVNPDEYGWWEQPRTARGNRR
jgi:hypothetical protein